MNKLIEKIQTIINEHNKANWCKDFYSAETIEQSWEAGKYETLTRLLDYIKTIGE